MTPPLPGRLAVSDPMRSRLRGLLVRSGKRLQTNHGALLRSTVSHVELGQALCRHNLGTGCQVAGREGVFDVATALVQDARSPLYLEFGVYRGESLRYWTERVTQPAARFVGFDSFEGLPERWRDDMPRGQFSTDGEVPHFDDGRVELVPGWFDDSLPGFTLPEHDQLVINVDADLYSSARTVLTELEPVIVPGTLLYFDEFNDSWNELRAFEEFLERTGRTMQTLAHDDSWAHWLFRCTG
jgi:hypothetical protein